MNGGPYPPSRSASVGMILSAREVAASCPCGYVIPSFFAGAANIMVRNPIRLSILALATFALAACGSSDGGTNSGNGDTPATPTPTALVVVSGNSQTGTVAQQLAAALLVQVNDQLGSPMANIAVGFAVTEGGGQVTAASVTTGSDGRASTNWTLGTTAGTNHKVTATVTSATSVTGTFSATGTAAAPTTLATSSPADQFGPAGGTLPNPIVVTVEDAFGNGRPGETVEFAVGASSGSVDPTTAVTDALLALLGSGGAFYLETLSAHDPWRVGLWVWVFALLTLAAALGAIAHGLRMDPRVKRRIWQVLNLTLAVGVALFVVGVVYDRWGLGGGSQEV